MAVVVDTREKRSVASLLEGRGLAVSYEKLDFGDYWLPESGVLFERKTETDLVRSVRDLSYWDQLKGLKSGEGIKSALILEGSIYRALKFTGFGPESIYGILAATALSFGVPIIPTRNPLDTATLIAGVARKEGRAFPLRFKPRAESLDDSARIVVEGFPGISAVRAVGILEHFGTVYNFVQNAEAVDQIAGIGGETKRKIMEVLHHKWRG